MAASDINKTILSGRLTHDPESRGGGKVTAFSIASNRFFSKNGGWEKDTLFIDVTAFGYEATNVLKLRKGDPVTCVGRLELAEWESQGSRRSKVRMVADTTHSPRYGKQTEEGVSEPGDAPIAADAPTPQPKSDIPF